MSETTVQETATGGIPEEMKLIVSLLSASHSMTTGTMDSLIHNLTYGGRRSEATVFLIRHRVRSLFGGPYSPNPDYVVAALYPSTEAVDEWLADHYDDWRDPASARHRHHDGGCCD